MFGGGSKAPEERPDFALGDEELAELYAAIDYEPRAGGDEADDAALVDAGRPPGQRPIRVVV